MRFDHEPGGKRTDNRHDSPDRKVNPTSGDDQTHAEGEQHDGRCAIRDINQTAIKVAVFDNQTEKPGSEKTIQKENGSQDQKHPAYFGPALLDGFDARILWGGKWEFNLETVVAGG